MKSSGKEDEEHSTKRPRVGKADRKDKQKAHIPESTLHTLENPAFAAYYQEQLQLTAAEWKVWDESLRKPLPVTWRFSGFDEAARLLRARMERELLPTLEHQPQALPWYPDRLAWQLDVSRAQLRGKDWMGADAPGSAGRTDAVKSFHSWLLRETDLGHVHRQEAVSMVPPLLLDVQPGHTVLDSCASPGSKAQELLEMLASSTHPSGLMVANDADIKR